MNETILMVLRKSLTIVATMLVARGFLPDTVIDQELITGIAGVVLLIISTFWSNSNKNKIVIANEVIGPKPVTDEVSK